MRVPRYVPGTPPGWRPERMCRVTGAQVRGSADTRHAITPLRQAGAQDVVGDAPPVFPPRISGFIHDRIYGPESVRHTYRYQPDIEHIAAVVAPAARAMIFLPVVTRTPPDFFRLRR